VRCSSPETHPERSYAIAVRLDGSPPEGMFISASSPTRSLRAHPVADGELLLVGGEGHKVGQGGPTEPRYRKLEEFARRHFPVQSVEYRWSAQDNMPVDFLPFVGKLTPRSRGTFVATGFRKWGLAMAPAAAENHRRRHRRPFQPVGILLRFHATSRATGGARSRDRERQRCVSLLR